MNVIKKLLFNRLYIGKETGEFWLFAKAGPDIYWGISSNREGSVVFSFGRGELQKHFIRIGWL